MVGSLFHLRTRYFVLPGIDDFYAHYPLVP